MELIYLIQHGTEHAKVAWSRSPANLLAARKDELGLWHFLSPAVYWPSYTLASAYTDVLWLNPCVIILSSVAVSGISNAYICCLTWLT